MLPNWENVSRIGLEASPRCFGRRKHRLIQTPAPDWLEKGIGSIQDEPAFEEALAYVRAIRKGELSIEDVGP